MYLEAQRSELALAGFNSSFAAYVHALSQLSSDKAISESNLNATKAGFEQSFGTASELLSILDKPGVSSNLSQILTAGVRAFLEYKQRRDIIRIIDAWQIVVDSYASQCQSLLNFSATIYHSDYQVMFDSLQGELEGYILSRNPGKSETKIIAQRARIIESMLDINDKLLAEFAGMSALYQYYGLVPAAHDALGKNLERHVINTSSLDTLIAYAKNIVELYKSITAKSQPAPPTAGQQAAS